MRKRLRICNNKGFHITFKNGWTVSVQFGAGNYCDNYDSNDWKCETSAESNTAEVWCWDQDENHYPEEPLGHQTPEEVFKIMENMKKRRNTKQESKNE